MIAVRGPKAGWVNRGMCVPPKGRGPGARSRRAGNSRIYCILGAKFAASRTYNSPPEFRRLLMPRSRWLALVACLVVAPSLFGQGKEAVLAGYTKYEYRVPMRDGVRLFTSVYVPKDDSKQYPILMTRTPYSVGTYGADKYKDNLGPSALFGKEGYIFVYQDVRGRWMSEGEFVNMRPHNPKKGPKDFDESTDTYDTIEWLLKTVKNHNGKVGQWGISYAVFCSKKRMIDAHPALKAVSPQAPINDWFVGEYFQHHGLLFLPHCFNFMANFGKPRPEPTTKFPYLKFE